MFDNPKVIYKSFLIISLFLVLFTGKNLYAEKYHTFSGYIKDAANGEALIGASVYIDSIKAGVSSNMYGFYSLTLPEGVYTVKIFTQGYSTIEKIIKLTGDIKYDIDLNVKPVEMKGIIVLAEKENENIRQPEMSSIKLIPSQIKSIPILMGEQDILKTSSLHLVCSPRRRGIPASLFAGEDLIRT